MGLRTQLGPQHPQRTHRPVLPGKRPPWPLGPPEVGARGEGCARRPPSLRLGGLLTPARAWQDLNARSPTVLSAETSKRTKGLNPHFQVQKPTAKMQASRRRGMSWLTCSCPHRSGRTSSGRPLARPWPQQLSPRPRGLRGGRLLGEGTQLGTAENGVLVLLSATPGPDEHGFVCPTLPWRPRDQPGISAWGSPTRVAAFRPRLTLEWVWEAL